MSQRTVADSESRPKRRVALPVSDVLTQTIHSLGISEKFSGWSVVEHWSEIAGSHIATHCEPVRYENGTLTLAVPDAVWRQELLAKTDLLLNAIHAYPGGTVITRISFVHGRKG